MKFSTPALAVLSLALSTHAQYFSEGWTPGAEPAATPTPIPAAAPGKNGLAKPGMFDLANILSYGPIPGLFQSLGINITERLASAQADADFWDSRVPLINDDTWEDEVVNEVISPEEAKLKYDGKERVWFIVISGTALKQDGLSKLLDEVFDQAYNQSLISNELPNVKFARIDYMNVTELTTRWNIWRAPYVLVATERGQKLRFYPGQTLRLSPDIIREFLKSEAWRGTSPWNTKYSPGGDLEFIMIKFGKGMRFVYDLFTVVPKWLMYLISGAFASFVLPMLHRSTSVTKEEEARFQANQKALKEKKEQEEGLEAVVETGAKTSATASPGKGVKARKGKK